MGIQESMGPIFDRSQEHLGAVDLGIIGVERRLLDSLRAFRAGVSPLGLDSSIDYGAIRSHRKLLPRDTPWREIANLPSDDLVPDYALAAVR